MSKCQRCGTQTSWGIAHCDACWETLNGSDSSTASRVHPADPPALDELDMWLYVGGGALAGAILGILFRPSLPFIGQLPVNVVITRGANLNGLDQVLSGAAEHASNLFLGAMLAGALAGWFAWKSLRSPAGLPPVSRPLPPPVSVSEPTVRPSVSAGQSPSEVEEIMGRPSNVATVGVKTIYIFPSLRVVFEDGKVVDVN